MYTINSKRLEEDLTIEAKRIANVLININNDKSNKKSLIELYDSLLDKKYSEYYYKVLVKIPTILADYNYEIVDVDNFTIHNIE